jgi:hypothetical protein
MQGTNESKSFACVDRYAVGQCTYDISDHDYLLNELEIPKHIQ